MNRKLFYIIALVLALKSVSSYSADSSDDPDKKVTFPDRFYDRSDYIDPWIMHAKIDWMHGSNTENFTLAGAALPTDGNSMYNKNSYGVNLGAERFFTDYLSIELDAGYSPMKSKELTGALIDGLNTYVYDQTGKITMYPIDGYLNIHPAPYGAIDPYFGIGYNYTFMESSYPGISIDDTNGLDLKAGVNFWLSDSFGVSFDVIKKFMTINSDYTNSFVGGVPVKSSVDYNPIEASVGVGYRF